MLLALAAIPVLASAVLGLLARPVSSRLQPATAVRVLVPAMFAAALATGFCLSVLAFNAITTVPAIARLGHWRLSPDPEDGTPPPLGGLLLAVIVIALLTAAVDRLVRTLAATVRIRAEFRTLGGASHRVVVLEDEVADAFAVPGLPLGPARIVLTTAMLQALDADERRVLVAHERAHLRHHHHLLIHLAELAARADPLLIPVLRQVRVLTERWADEDAAAAVASRRLAARAVAKAALARTTSVRRRALNGTGRCPASGVAGTLAATSTDVPGRVLALTQPQPTGRIRFAGALVALALAGIAAAGSLAYTTANKFEHAAAEHARLHASTSATVQHRGNDDDNGIHR
jgi:hypothetical protein